MQNSSPSTAFAHIPTRERVFAAAASMPHQPPRWAGQEGPRWRLTITPGGIRQGTKDYARLNSSDEERVRRRLRDNPFMDPDVIVPKRAKISDWSAKSRANMVLVLALVAAIVLIIVIATQANDGDDDPSASDTTSSAPTSSAPTTESSATEESSSAPAEVEINEADYLGRNVDVVATELRAKGLEVDTRPIDNPGGEDADTVASVRPTTGLVEGDTVTVEYYREAEPTSEPPSSEPTSEPPPSETSSPSAPTSPASSASDAQDTQNPSTSAPAASAAGSGGAR